MELLPTRNTIPAKDREQITDQLNERLAQILDLQLQVKQAHWNIKGPTFIALHLLFDDLAESLEDYADLIAERCVQLGGVAKGTVQAISAGSNLDDYPLRHIKASEHLLYLTTALAEVGDKVRAAIGWTDDLDDAATSDILTEVSRGLDVWLWKVEAHTQE
jgi:starvation-inducible DNA-binding protein